MSVPDFKVPSTDDQNKELKKSLNDHIVFKLKEIRKSRGLTQEELAEKTGLHLTYIGHLETGTYHPSVFVLWKISKVLNVQINEFVE